MTNVTQALAAPDLSALYMEDETAWLEAMAALIRRRDFARLDFDNLSEYLTDMAARDRREVRSRLVLLLSHLLKWEYQPDKRSGSWRATILNQRQELGVLASRGVLRVHAGAILGEAFDDAADLADAETGLPRSTFPSACPHSFDELLRIDVAENGTA